MNADLGSVIAVNGHLLQAAEEALGRGLGLSFVSSHIGHDRILLSGIAVRKIAPEALLRLR